MNAIVKERRTNRELGITSLDKRLRRAARVLVSIAAFVGGKIVGHCEVSRRKPTDERHTGLFGIVILGGYRGIGIGQTMVKKALEEALRRGV